MAYLIKILVRTIALVFLYKEELLSLIILHSVEVFQNAFKNINGLG